MNDWLHIDEVPPSIGVDLSVTPKIHYPPQGMTSDVAIVNSGNSENIGGSAADECFFRLIGFLQGERSFRQLNAVLLTQLDDRLACDARQNVVAQGASDDPFAVIDEKAG